MAQVGEDGRERLCACISRSLNVHEAKYPSYYGELLAVTWALRSFHPYVWGRPIKLVTDHQPLVWLMNADQKKNAHHTRWALMVDQYDLVVVHRAGASHANADVPSRFPLASDEDHTGSRLDSGDEVKVGGNIRLATPKEYAAWYGAVAKNPGNAAASVDEKRVSGAAVALRISRERDTVGRDTEPFKIEPGFRKGRGKKEAPDPKKPKRE